MTGTWRRLFAPRRQPQPEQRQPQPGSQREPTSTGSLPPWAETLQANKDYGALAAVIYEPFSDDWWTKVRLAQGILKASGSEAVPAILEEISKNGKCPAQLADVLVSIDDSRSVPFLKQAFLNNEFTYRPDLQRDVETFLAKFQPGFEEEQKLLRAGEAAAADDRLTAPPADGTELREYSTAYLFGSAAHAKRAFGALRSALQRGNKFPLDAPHQIALVHGPAADFVAVLVRLATANDESSALRRRVTAWFVETGTGSPEDYEWLSAPLPGRLSSGLSSLADDYTVLEIIDRLSES